MIFYGLDCDNMNYKPFPENFWTQIQNTVESLKKENTPLIAAFDADGTLWDTDLGENFFNYQIENNLISLPPAPLEHYVEMKKLNNDPRNAYVWLAQINEGIALNQVQDWALQAFKSIQPNPLFSEQQKLIQFFKQNGVQVYIVTASIKWAVQPGAIAIGLTEDDVIGVETEVIGGQISKNAILPITYRQGKVDALLKKTNGKVPFFCSGNSSGDIELLQCSSHLRLAVSAASRDDKLFKSEKELLDLAEKNNWLHHRFI